MPVPETGLALRQELLAASAQPPARQKQPWPTAWSFSVVLIADRYGSGPTFLNLAHPTSVLLWDTEMTMHRQQQDEGVFTPEEVVVIAEAFQLARRTFLRRLTKEESQALAQVLVSLARKGPIDAKKLATRTIARVL